MQSKRQQLSLSLRRCCSANGHAHCTGRNPSHLARSVWATRSGLAASACRNRSPVQHRRKSTLQPTKGEKWEGAGHPFGHRKSGRPPDVVAHRSVQDGSHDHDNRSYEELQTNAGR